MSGQIYSELWACFLNDSLCWFLLSTLIVVQFFITTSILLGSVAFWVDLKSLIMWSWGNKFLIFRKQYCTMRCMQTLVNCKKNAVKGKTTFAKEITKLQKGFIKTSTINTKVIWLQVSRKKLNGNVIKPERGISKPINVQVLYKVPRHSQTFSRVQTLHLLVQHELLQEDYRRGIY